MCISFWNKIVFPAAVVLTHVVDAVDDTLVVFMYCLSLMLTESLAKQFELRLFCV